MRRRGERNNKKIVGLVKATSKIHGEMEMTNSFLPSFHNNFDLMSQFSIMFCKSIDENIVKWFVC